MLWNIHRRRDTISLILLLMFKDVIYMVETLLKQNVYRDHTIKDKKII